MESDPNLPPQPQALGVHAGPVAAVEGPAKRLRLGNEDALGPWYEAEYPKVHRLCLGFLGSQSEADDLAQDAMLHLAEKMNHWNPARPYEAWRNTVIRNLCRDRIRAQSRRRDHEQTAAERRSETVVQAEPLTAETEELESLLERALGYLPPREREVFVLIDLEGLSTSEASQQLGVAGSTLRASLSMARRKLRERLAHLLPGADA